MRNHKKKDEGINLNLPRVSDVLVDGENCRGAHVTTRPHNRKVVYHAPSGTWFIVHGTGSWISPDGEDWVNKSKIVWRSSTDGKKFSDPIPVSEGNGHSSSVDVLLVGDRIYVTGFRFHYWRLKGGIPFFKDGLACWHPDRANNKGPLFYAPNEIFSFNIISHGLVAGDLAVTIPGDKHIGVVGPHYGSITRDTNGYIWATARAGITVHEHFETRVTRTINPDDICSWKSYTVLFRSRAPGTHAPQIIALDEGRVVCVLFTKPEKRTVVYLFDPDTERWGEPHIIGEGFESKRASAVFDPKSRRLHVVYTDETGDARHRALSAPYGIENWSPQISQPGNLVAKESGANKGDDDLSLSVNLSKNLGTLALVHRGPDLHLHLKYYDGNKWLPKDVKIGIQNPALTCDEANAVADSSHGLGFVYWCKWKDPEVWKEKNSIGRVRFCLVKDVAILFR